MSDLFGNESGAEFSECRKYRYALWRIWDNNKPFVMFIGLNPSTANENVNDPTIRRVISIAKNLGYGGVYMMNCFAYVSTDPDELVHNGNNLTNNRWLVHVSNKCKDIIFAWGNFKIVKDTARDFDLMTMFPNALALQINKNGSPKHPLYVKSNIQPVEYNLYQSLNKEL